MTLDHVNNLFSYQATTYPASPNLPTTGSLTGLNGFLKLKTADASPAGYAIEIPSRAVLLRPGDATAAPVFAVQQATCFALTGKVRFQQVLLFDGSHGPAPVNPDGSSVFVQAGSSRLATIVANTDGSGESWQFGAPVGGFVQPESYAGACKAQNGQASISVAANSNGTLPASLVFGETGFMFEEFNLHYAPWSVIGIAEPTSPLSTSSVTATKYIGFFRATLPGARGATTQLVAFAPAMDSISLAGGPFTNDDPNQTSRTDYSFAPGSQDAASPGIYSAAKLTYPDPTQACATNPTLGSAGIDSNGNPTCTTTMTTIIANTEGKNVIFSTSGELGTLYLFER